VRVHHTLLWRRAAGLIVAALIGGGIALGGAAALGDLGSSTTVIREEAFTQTSSPAAFQQTRARSINEIYRGAAPGVVHIDTASQAERAVGSGFVIDKAGHIVTNYHVVRGATSIRVSFSNNERIKAKVVGVDPSTDLAVLKVDVKSRALRSLPLGNSDTVRVGDEVIAIGNPFGLDRSVTSGIVSAVQRRIEAPNQLSIEHVIQTDAALNHGNSGGPLLDAGGDVIGVNAQIETGSSAIDGNVGVGFAIPVNTVRDVAAKLIRDGKVEHPFLGIEGKTLVPSIARLFHLPARSGVLVVSVRPGSGAAKAGLRGATNQVMVEGESWPAGGDLIVEADGQRVPSIERLIDLVAAKQPGDKLRLRIVRGSEQMNITVKLGRQT
jgi:putative serine protease PepD